MKPDPQIEKKDRSFLTGFVIGLITFAWLISITGEVFMTYDIKSREAKSFTHRGVKYKAYFVIDEGRKK